LGKDKDISFISAKKGRGVRELLLRVIQEIPPPKKNLKDTLKALVFDANYDPHRGIIAYIRIFDGVLKKGEKIYLIGAKTQSKAQEIGIFAPGLQPKNELNAGEIGYVVTNVKEPNKVLIGDILTHSPTLSPNFSVCTGFKKPQPKVFASIYPEKETDFSKLAQSLSILSLSDSAFQFRPESSSLFNNGFLIGALGNFHLQIIQERLEKEFNLATVLTLPIVSYKFLLNDKKKINSSTIEKIDFSKVKKVYEPKAKIKIITPLKYQGKITDFLFQKEAEFLGSDFLEESQRIILEFKLPLLQVMRGLYNKILSLSSGFASMDYEFLGYEDEDLVKVDIYVAEKIFAPLSFLNKRKNAYKEAKNRVEKIKKFLPRQLFELDIKAKIGTKVIAKARIPALRKDVLAKLYGGDRTRKDKLLKKQKIGKKRMKKIGQLSLPSDFFLKISQI